MYLNVVFTFILSLLMFIYYVLLCYMFIYDWDNPVIIYYVVLNVFIFILHLFSWGNDEDDDEEEDVEKEEDDDDNDDDYDDDDDDMIFI